MLLNVYFHTKQQASIHTPCALMDACISNGRLIIIQINQLGSIDFDENWQECSANENELLFKISDFSGPVITRYSMCSVRLTSGHLKRSQSIRIDGIWTNRVSN